MNFRSFQLKVYIMYYSRETCYYTVILGNITADAVGTAAELAAPYSTAAVPPGSITGSSTITCWMIFSNSYSAHTSYKMAKVHCSDYPITWQYYYN